MPAGGPRSPPRMRNPANGPGFPPPPSDENPFGLTRISTSGENRYGPGSPPRRDDPFPLAKVPLSQGISIPIGKVFPDDMGGARPLATFLPVPRRFLPIGDGSHPAREDIPYRGMFPAHRGTSFLLATVSPAQWANRPTGESFPSHRGYSSPLATCALPVVSFVPIGEGAPAPTQGAPAPTQGTFLPIGEGSPPTRELSPS